MKSLYRRQICILCLEMILSFVAVLSAGAQNPDDSSEKESGKEDGGLLSRVESLDFYSNVKCKKDEVPVFIQGAAFAGKDITLIFAAEMKELNTFPGFLPREDFCNYIEEKCKIKKGLLFHIDEKHFWYDTDILAGNLKFSRSVSRLKKPSLSCPSALASVSLLLPGISPSLPSFSSSKTPDALALSFTPSKRYSFLPGVDFAALEDGSWYVSFWEQKTLGSASKIVFSYNRCEFVHGGKSSNSWFYSEPFYVQSRYTFCDLELGVKLSNFFVSNTIIGFCENPFAGFADSYFWERNQTRIKAGSFAFNFAVFNAENAYAILPSGSRLNMKRQIMINPQFAFGLPCGDVKFGTLVQKECRPVKLSAARSRNPFNSDGMMTDSETYDVYTLKFLFAWQNGSTKFNVQYARKDDESSGKTEHTAKFSFEASGDVCKSVTSLSVKSCDGKKTFTWRESVTPGCGFLTGVYVGGTRTYVDGFYLSSSLNAGLTLFCRSKYVRWQGKLSYSVTF